MLQPASPNHHPVSAQPYLQLLTSAASYAGRKAENQDALVVHTLSAQPQHSTVNSQHWLVTALADGVSSCQSPKQASSWVIETLIDQLTRQQAQLVNDINSNNLADPTVRIDHLAPMVTKTVQIINDFLYFNDDHYTAKAAAHSAALPRYLSTLTGMLFTEQTALLFHTGDSRIYRLRHNQLSILTKDQRHQKGRDKGALSAALGADANVDLQLTEVDRLPEDVFLIMTDGVYEFISEEELLLVTESALGKFSTRTDLSTTALENLPKLLCQVALESGSNDNVSCVMVTVLPKTLAEVDERPNTPDINNDKTNTSQTTPEAVLNRLQIPPVLAVGDVLDHFTIQQVIQNTPRSTVYLATDATADANDNLRILKVPSAYYDDDSQYLRLFLKEEKIGLSFDHPSLLKFYAKPIHSHYLYHVTEYVQGISLREWIETQPVLSVNQTFDLISQIGLALRVMHRNYLLHQDIKPENIMLLPSGGIKLIDFGSVGSMLLKTAQMPPVGDLHYTAPEYFSDAPKGVFSDVFSLGVVTYELLTGQQPFDVDTLSNAHTSQKLTFKHVQQWRPELPFWVNDVLIRAMQPDSRSRYQGIGDFLADLDPKSHVTPQTHRPLIEANPVLFWQLISAVLLITLIAVLIIKR